MKLNTLLFLSLSIISINALASPNTMASVEKCAAQYKNGYFTGVNIGRDYVGWCIYGTAGYYQINNVQAYLGPWSYDKFGGQGCGISAGGSVDTCLWSYR